MMQGLNAILRKEIESGESNPNRIAEAVLKAISAEERDELALWGLRERARAEIRSLRGRLVASGSAPGPSRWGSDRDRWLRLPFNVGGEWKQLGDCSRADVESIAWDYGQIARENEEWSHRFHELSRAMASSGVLYVRDLPEGVRDEQAELIAA